MNDFKTLVVFRHLRGYADNLFLRQTSALPSSTVVVPYLDFGNNDVRVANRSPKWATKLLRGIGRAFEAYGGSVGFDPLTDRRLRSLAAGFDVVYTPFLWTATSVHSALPVRRGIPPLVAFAAGGDITTAQHIGPEYVRRVEETARRASVVLCGSHFLANRLREIAPRANVVVQYIGIPIPAQTSARPRRSDDSIRLVAISRLEPVKGVEFTIRAFHRAFPLGSRASLTIVGDGSLRQPLEGLLSTLGEKERVRLVGYLKPGRVVETLGQADIFVQHNVTAPDGATEALGGSMLEASAARLPIVGTRSGGVPEAVVHGETGLLVEPKDIDGMAAAIALLASDPDLRRRMGSAGRRFVSAYHNASLQDQRFSAVMADVVSGQGGLHGRPT